MSKLCSCGQPITKPFYKKCFKCNTSKESDEELEEGKVDDITPYKKQNIPKTVKNCVWINTYGNNRTGVCRVCMREEVSINSFQACHIIAEKNGGLCTLDNLMVGCGLCNSSMGICNALEFIEKFNLHYGLKNKKKGLVKK